MDTPEKKPQTPTVGDEPKASPTDAPAAGLAADDTPATDAGPQPEDSTKGAAETARPAAPRRGRRLCGAALDGCASLYARSGGLAGWARRPVFWLAVLPIVLSSLYFGLIATDMYVSSAEMTVRSSKAFSSEGASGLLASATSLMGQSTDLYVVNEYIRSQDLMRLLESEIGLRSHYSSRNADIFSRLKRDATDEELLKYYQSAVSVSIDSVSGIIKLKVRAYDAGTAHRLAQKIIKYSEALVNRMSERAVKDTLGLAQSEMERAEARVNIARLKIKQFRLAHADFNPTASTTATMGILAGLEGDQAKASAELSQLRSFMREDSPQVVTAKSKVAALAGQIAAEQSRLTGGGNGKTGAVLQYEELATEYDFAQRMLDGARQALEQSRVQAQAKTRYLEAFVQPNLPEEATYPERLLGIGLTIVLSFLGFGLITLAWAAIKEHAGF